MNFNFKKSYLDNKFPSLNRGQIIGCIQENISLGWVLDNFEKIGIDNKELQRYLQEWKPDEIDEYLTNVLFGQELKDTFQLIVLDEQIKWIKEELNLTNNKNKQDKLKKDLKYFEYWKNEKKMTYLCIDGQHRLWYLWLFLTSQLTINITQPEKDQWIYNNKIIELSNIHFKEYPDEVKEVIKSIQLACIFWAKASLTKFAFIFTSCNKGKSPHPHELRSVFNKGDWGSFCSEILLDCPDRDRIWKSTIHLTNKITFEQKADTYYLASLFPFWYKESGYNQLPFSSKYDFINTDFLYDVEYNIPKNVLKEYYKDIKDIYTYIKALNPKKFTTCQFTNLLYYHIKYTKVGIGPDERIYNIKKPLEFINKFIDDDKDREERDMFEVDKKGEFIFKDGEKIVKEHRYSKKNSTNTYNNVEYRKNFMNQDIFDNISLFEEKGIIQKLGNRNTGLTAEDVAYHNDYKDRSGKPLDKIVLRSKDVKNNYVINEEKAASQGGDRTLDNTNIMKQNENLNLYNTEQKYENS